MAVRAGLPSGVDVLTRSAWREVLFRHVSGIELEPIWRRRGRRYAVGFGIWRLLYHNHQRLPMSTRVHLLNASADGLMLMCREEVPERGPVLLAYRDGEDNFVLAGEVMHSTSTVGGHKIGVALHFSG